MPLHSHAAIALSARAGAVNHAQQTYSPPRSRAVARIVLIAFLMGHPSASRRPKASPYPSHEVNKRIGDEPCNRQWDKSKECGDHPMPLRITHEVLTKLLPARRPHLIIWSVFAVAKFVLCHTVVKLRAGTRPCLVQSYLVAPEASRQNQTIEATRPIRCQPLRRMAHRVWFSAITSILSLACSSARPRAGLL